ncbi:hypothetical protein SCHIN_v1c04760 [Spiroplasma chinense]|uniref:Transmembrane protein n=1 Tax=Spiroplasma chinense TaxID=216932 RepID=A0A5B9Y4H8_9MOLU|nr:hypothetical protein [Spiroplasma chinense]QEH61673.1 hypothetical protein SCHIN_v1c04760 [Spiroplasma chinense]
MKKIISIFWILAIGLSTLSLSISSFDSKNNENKINYTNNYHKEEIIEKLSDHFEKQNVKRNAIFDSYDIVLEYFAYNALSDSIYVDIEKMLIKGESMDLIVLFETEAFKEELNKAFEDDIFIYQDELIQYKPYLEDEYFFDTETGLTDIDNSILQRSQKAYYKLYTKWYWFGTYKLTLNNQATIELLNILNLISTSASLASYLILRFAIAGAAGVLVSAILSQIADYLFVVGHIISVVNRGYGVYFWATVIIVWYVKAL